MIKNTPPGRRMRPHAPGQPRRPLADGVRPRSGRPTADRLRPQRPPATTNVTGRGQGIGQKRPLKPRGNGQQASMPPLGEVDRPADILLIMHELSQVLQTENDALTRHDHTTIHNVMERKRSLTRAYLEHMVTLHRNPDLLQSFPPERAEELKQAGEMLEDVSRKNEALLKAEITAANMFIGAVTDAVRDIKEDSQSSYNDTGRLDGTQAENRRLAIALNKEF